MPGWDAGDWVCAGVVVLFIVVAIALVVYLYWTARPRVTTAGVPVAYGLDFSWGRPPVDAIIGGGWSFVCRYGCYGESGKKLSAAEAAEYLAAGILPVSNWEHEAAAWKQGYARGWDDAVAADPFFRSCGAGPQDPIYFSIDTDVLDSELPVAAAYLQGIRDVIGWERTGAYGGYKVIRYLFDKGLIRFGWQTYAWSYGKWEPRAQIRQVLNGQDLAGHAVDYNEAWHAVYGGWGQSGQPYSVEGSVILNCPDDPERQDILYVGPGGEVWHRWVRGGIPAWWTGPGSAENIGGSIVVGTLAATWLADGSGISVIGLGKPDADATNCPEGCGQYWGYIIGRAGTKSGWGSMVGCYGQYPVPPGSLRAGAT